MKASKKSGALYDRLLSDEEKVIALIKRSVSFVTGEKAPVGKAALVRSVTIVVHDHEWRCVPNLRLLLDPLPQ